jgi:hypothetical protein
MKKFYYIYKVTETGKRFSYLEEKTFSQHSAVEWINDHLKNKKYENNKYTIREVYEKSK